LPITDKQEALMPGGRLTHEDRAAIAAGLAAGLGYAEIARRLDRPTSTITREVARNGGPAGYRADQAAKATSTRARRRKPAPVSIAPETDDRTREFEDRFTEIMVQSGLSRMASRVLTSLYLTDSGSLTSAELVQRLRVSPASISKAIGYLEALGLVVRERDATARRERYVVDDDTWARSWSASIRTNALWADLARQGVQIFGADTMTGVRLNDIAEFLDRLYHFRAGDGRTPVADDALTALAALVHAATPLGADELATALGWSRDRVAKALQEAEEHPDVADPVALRRTGSGAYAVTARLSRLTAAQREALDSNPVGTGPLRSRIRGGADLSG
jgi:DNA-binding transcriptional regulator GbsR (MarR family)